ncbi:ABC transporter permease [Pusillimonas sp. ANT_WB101]|uniref:ABC transporter permease n=1 Tax=Pusillimonas sp. ANT_WB101 TaxID=2597356 RepID=UPI0011EEF498|nr:ABC transporter permease [Pusillimonas sp. ANT_WB101]KAA0892576.1 ABC transporter permease [Pusillimonas sp. ANT_WB101]
MMAIAARKRVASTVWMVAPLLILMIVGFNLPILMMLGKSLFRGENLSFEAYSNLIETSVYLKVLGNTFKIAVITTVCCVLLGYPLAYWLRGLSLKWQMIGLAAIVIPFWISILVRTYAWIVILGNSGVINRTLIKLGWIDTPISFLYNQLGVVIGTINVLLPFLVLPLFASMMKIDDGLMKAAETLGAGRMTVFWRIFFPLSLPALAAGAVLVFILTLGFYITPAILGGGRVPMIANMLDLLINQMPNWEMASSISVVLLVFSMALFVFYLRFTAEEKAI